MNARGERWELQLKGAGLTPFSRRADGRAVLRSSLREYVASEALHFLGVPTTRALSLVATNDQVLRDMFYNGKSRLEPGAVVCRVAQSFVRFGAFQLPASRGDDALVKQLLEYCIRHHFPTLVGTPDAPAAFLREVAERTGRLAAAWQAVGFVHGVMNTDNMSIIGDTIDYGPFGFLEIFDPSWTPNVTDFEGRRYCHGAQPRVALWNVSMLANALLSAGVMTQEEAQAGVDAYAPAFRDAFEQRFAAKLGLRQHSESLLRGLFELMEGECDFTRTFRWLSRVPATVAAPDATADELLAPLRDVLPPELPAERRASWAAWLRLYRGALAGDALPPAERAALQDGANPLYVPRNYLLQECIEAAEGGDYTKLADLMRVLRAPYTEQPGCEAYAAAAPEWALSRPGVCMLSCSS